jgi:prephenate dehydrogenase
MKDLKQVTVIGLGLLGGSLTLTIQRTFPNIKAAGYSHRPSTRTRARQLSVANEVFDDIHQSVAEADIVVLATPVSTFEDIFTEIARSLPDGCIVTDVGSTKNLAHKWAAARLPSRVHYIGSHPIAGSEQRGVEYCRDDLFYGAVCVLTTNTKTNPQALQSLEDFWKKIGCIVKRMTPAQHDRVFANVSHVPHVVAASLVNANKDADLEYAGKGFMDASRIASGPAGIWSDILLTNAANTVKGIERVIKQLQQMKSAIASEDKDKVRKLLEMARAKRAALIEHKLRSEDIS